MSPRDTLAADLATLLPGCVITTDSTNRIRVRFPGLGNHEGPLSYLAVSKTGRRVESCDFQGRTPIDTTPPGPAVTAGDAAQIAVDSLIRRWWSRASPTLRELEVLAALGFVDKVPALVHQALTRIERERTDNAELIRTRQALDAKLAAEQDAYRALLETP